MRYLHINKNTMKRTVIFILFLIFAAEKTVAQIVPVRYSLLVVENDTFVCITLSTYICVSAKSKRDAVRYTRLVRNVQKVYPYARIAAVKLQEYDEMLAKIPDADKQKKLMKEAERQLRKQFQKDIEDLTFSQGLILLKLVDRETGKTTYKIVDELRGSLRAFFYQSIARLFKMNLKVQYDPDGADKDIEKIVRMIENGEL